MEKHVQLTEERIRATRDRIWEHRYEDARPLKAAAVVTREPVRIEEARRHPFRAIRSGQAWGKTWDCAWFKLTGALPAHWRNLDAKIHQPVAHIDLGGEACWMSPEGTPRLGLISETTDGFRRVFLKNHVPVERRGARGGRVELWVEAGANALTSPQTYQNLISRHIPVLKTCELALWRADIFQLYIDFEVLLELMFDLPAKAMKRAVLRRTLNDACNAIGDFTPGEVSAARKALEAELAKPAHATALTLSAMGHAHIDLAWLWPVRETIRKAGRTVATQLDLLRRYPEYKFGASQPHLYQFVKDRYPRLYAEIRKRVAEGRWEPQGAMWVEPDCNLSGGEALVRQLLYGKRFFMREFGVEADNLWLPDVFGYSAALPQILRKGGVRYFLTQKISWSQFNKFPHHTFKWTGIDGSAVFAHFPPADSYNSDNGPANLRYAQNNFQESDRSRRAMHLYGIGDGGHGPSEMHLERQRRVRNLEGVPRLSLEFAREFFRKAERDIKDLPEWHGELYLELHRGTLTSQAFQKWANRRCELSLRAAEMLAALGTLPRPAAYPQREFERLWKIVLFNQFHDILPGSSITRVYEESRTEYRGVLARTESLSREFLGRLAGGRGGKASARVAAFNPLSWQRGDLLRLPPAEGYADSAGDGVQCQRVRARRAEPAGGGTLLDASLPSAGVLYFTASAKTRPSASDLKTGPNRLENRFVRVTFNARGQLSELFDKRVGRNLLAPGEAGNRLALYEDLPNKLDAWYDAWDVDMFYEEKPPAEATLLRARVVERGPLRAAIEFQYAVGVSRIVQEVRLAVNSPRIDFVTRVDWREAHRMLRTSFPTSITAPQAAFEIQYGHLFRPTHRNTSWDYAKFEVVAHRWADLSDNDCGLALLNDCKYGHKIHRSILDLNLLRSPKIPDPDADMGAHFFTYALLPHAGNLCDGEVVRRAHELNQPPVVAHVNGPSLQEGSLLSVDSPHVNIESVKRREDGPGLIVRMYEIHGRRVKAELRLRGRFSSAALADLLERPARGGRLPRATAESGTSVQLSFNPFEIVTVLLK